MSWKRELNRIKKRYGLRMKDTFGEDPVRAPEGYVDRAAGRLVYLTVWGGGETERERERD